MNLCDDGHDEVCYDSNFCPVCMMRNEKNEEIKSIESKEEELRGEITSLEREVASLQTDNDELKAE